MVLAHPIGTSLLLMPFYALVKPVVSLGSVVVNVPFDQRHPLFFMAMCAGIVMYAYLGGVFLLKT